MARVGLSRPKAVHGLEIVGHGLDISKYDALSSAYVDLYDVRTSRSANFEFVGHGHPKKIAIDASKISQHLPRLDQGAVVSFEALATPIGLLERGGCVLRDTTQGKVSNESLRSIAWGKNTDHENGVRSEVHESIDVTRIIAEDEVETGLFTSSLQGNVSSSKSTMPNEIPMGLQVNDMPREIICDDSENMQLHKSELDAKPKVTKSDLLNNKLIPNWNVSVADPAQKQRNQSLTFCSSAVQKSPRSTFSCHSAAAESFADVIASMNSSFPVRQSRKSSQPPRPLSCFSPIFPNQRPRHFSAQRGTPRQSSSCHDTLFVVGHNRQTYEVNTHSAETSGYFVAPFQRTKEIESEVGLGPRGSKFSSRMSGRIMQKNEHKIKVLSGDWVNKWFLRGAKNKLCNNSATDSGMVTNGYTPPKQHFTPKSKPVTTSPVKSPTSPSYSKLGHSQPKPQNSASVNSDQNGGRMIPSSGVEPPSTRTQIQDHSRTSVEKSDATYGRNLSEAKVTKSFNSDSMKTSSIENQIFCNTNVNRVIGSPVSPKLNGFCNPDGNRTNISTAYNTKVENFRNQMENSTVTVESSESQMENFKATVAYSETQKENAAAPEGNSKATTQFSTATVENLDTSRTPVSFVNKVTVCLSPRSRSPAMVPGGSPAHTSQLHSVQSPEPVLNGSTDLSSDLTCNNSSTNNNEEPTTETKECNGHQFIEAQLQTSDSMTLNVEKDGQYFLGLVAQVESGLKKSCAELEQFLAGSIPDEASGKIRAAIGKANLLMTKKFKQFRELCNNNLTQSHEDQFQTTSEDLTGYWDMVQLQVDEIQRLFHDIHILQSNNWIDSEPQIAPLSPKATESRAKEHTSQSPKKPRTSTVSEASKAREESRKRLMAAKMAGRQRKASESKEEIQIFIS